MLNTKPVSGKQLGANRADAASSASPHSGMPGRTAKVKSRPAHCCKPRPARLEHLNEFAMSCSKTPNEPTAGVQIEETAHRVDLKTNAFEPNEPTAIAPCGTD